MATVVGGTAVGIGGTVALVIGGIGALVIGAAVGTGIVVVGGTAAVGAVVVIGVVVVADVVVGATVVVKVAGTVPSVPHTTIRQSGGASDRNSSPVCLTANLVSELFDD